MVLLVAPYYVVHTKQSRSTGERWHALMLYECIHFLFWTYGYPIGDTPLFIASENRLIYHNKTRDHQNTNFEFCTPCSGWPPG